MPDSSLAVTGGSVDTRTISNNDHRPVSVVGDEVGDHCARVTAASAVGGAVTGSQGNALNVNVNALQKATYLIGATNLVSGALTANTFKAILSIEHAATSLRTLRIRRVLVAGYQTTALAGLDTVAIFRGTAASTAGTVVTAQPAIPASAAAEAVFKTVPTIVAATQVVAVATSFGATANTGWMSTSVYDWQEAGETSPLTLRAGSLDSLVVGVISSAAKNYTLGVTVICTEE